MLETELIGALGRREQCGPVTALTLQVDPELDALHRLTPVLTM
jgi:hypothetical protein